MEKPFIGKRKPLLEEDGKNDCRQAKITFSSPCPPKAPALKMEKPIIGKRKQLLEEDGKKTIVGKRKSLFQAPAPQGTSSKEKLKNDYRQANIIFSSPLPPKAPALEEDGKKRFSAGKNHFFSTYPFQGTSTRVWPFQAPTLQIHPKE